jgi:hypothetical protein
MYSAGYAGGRGTVAMAASGRTTFKVEASVEPGVSVAADPMSSGNTRESALFTAAWILFSVTMSLSGS